MHELMEGHGEHGAEAHDPLVTKVSLTISIIAVVLAAVTMFGHRANTEELLIQSQSADQWAFYQAKSIREHGIRNTLALAAVITTVDKEKAEKLKQDSEKELERYEKEKEKISETAKDQEKERGVLQHKVDRFDAGESLLEIGLVICSITLLTRKRAFWLAGTLIAVAGLAFGVSGFLLH